MRIAATLALLVSIAGGCAAGLPGRAMALEATGIDVSSERALPEACVTFDEKLAQLSDLELRSYVQVEPAGDRALSARGDRLCIGGLQHGHAYRVQLRAGLPAADGSSLEASAAFDAAVPDRAPAVSFRGNGDVLPLGSDPVLPVVSVNVATVRLDLFQVTDRALIQRLAENAVGWQQSEWDLERLREQSGRLLFSGSVEVTGERNREVTTAVPLADLLRKREPGVYIAVARPADAQPEQWQGLPTRWFALTDTGLLTWQGEDGLLVQAASLSDGQPLAGRELVLMARANRRIATATTGADGFARFAAGELRGEGGDAPRALFAYGQDGDFIWLDLERAGLDLTDRGVAGRTPPGALDAFLWTERGVYRPGETVHLGLLLRDRDAHAVSGQKLVLVTTRPDQVEVDRRQVDPAALGGALVELPLADSAFPGTWTVTAHLGDGTAPIGRVVFAVDDIVPPRLEATLTGPATIAAGSTVELQGQADYLFGAPGAGLATEAELVVQPDAAPFPAWRGWRFGLEEEPFQPQREALSLPATDAAGRVELPVALGPVDSAGPLVASVEWRVSDLDGRPVVARHEMKVAQAGHVAIRPDFTGALPENATAGFAFAAMDGAGVARAGAGLEWRLLEEDVDYLWVRQGGDWSVETVVTDRLLDAGRVESGADGTVRLERAVTSGRYRIELADPLTGSLASVRFAAGWWSVADAAERPDKVEIRPAGDEGSAGLRLFVRPPYQSRVILALADTSIRATAVVELGPDGGFVTLSTGSLDLAEAGGRYVLATALAAPGVAHPRLPARAVGVLPLPGGRAGRTLELALDLPTGGQPEQKLPVAVEIGNLAPGESAFVAVMAVDDAVLQMTGHQPADPAGYFLGQRALGVTLRDVYGRLIDPDGVRGRIVTGGDARMALQFTGNTVRSHRIVSLVAGPVAVDGEGRAAVDLPVPAFDGRLAVSVVAWSADQVGQADAKILVRGPVVAELTRPRFLGTGDLAELVLEVQPGEGPLGKWQAELAADGPLTLDPAGPLTMEVAPGRPARHRITAQAGTAPGTATVRLALTGPDGVRLERRFTLAVRSPWPFQAERTIADLAPGQTLVIDDSLGRDFLPGTAEAEISVGPLPELGLARLIDSLSTYPYGCVEQTVSKAAPLLAARALRPALGLGPEPAVATVGLQDSVRRLVDLQNAGGGFGLWTPSSPVETWLSAYVGDFLLRAQEQGIHVPLRPFDQLAERLALAFSADDSSPAGLQARAYAGHVLARLGRLDAATLRWFEGRYLADLPSDLARAQLAAAIAATGDRPRGLAVAASLNGVRQADAPLMDYGSELRDAAGSLALLLEAGLIEADERDRRLAQIASAYGDPGALDTQSQAWLLRAGASLIQDRSAETGIRLDGRPVGGLLHLVQPIRPGMAPLRIEHGGTEPLYRTITVAGLPVEPQPAAEEGFTLRRRVLRLDGQPVAQAADRPGRTTLAQGERVVVLLEGTVRQTGDRRILLVDLLPAGLEIEPLELGPARPTELGWLGDLTPPVASASRDDRFAAALGGWSPSFRLAYVARATTPGQFVWPASRVEDMYDPASFARTRQGRLEVTAR
ncbi:alpha-2-macroglobulin family protein [Geminicoccus harenae]|uniref:alpha-2-macroglobulin family protein n=3 Tax=Geminicoccus harenae TaxID=2498453 RepID=UPI001C980206|nr:alpha-2-macroglobulin [Geminicoccus harenae]